MGRYLAAKVQSFEEADHQGAVDLEIVIDKCPIPTPIPYTCAFTGGRSRNRRV